MLKTMMAGLMAAGLAAVVAQGPALAQTAQGQGGLTPQELDKLSQQRQEELGPRNWGSPPPQSTVAQPALHQPKSLLVCMGTDAWQPIYAKPSTGAAVIGKTLPEIAVSGRNIDGFTPIVYGAGRTGYVPASAVHPFV